MPRDKDGNVVDFIVSPDSIPGRMNTGKLYDPYFGAAARDVRKEILEILGYERSFLGEVSIEEVKRIPHDRYMKACERLAFYYQIISSRQHNEFVNVYTDEERYEEISDILSAKWLTNFLPVDSQENYPEVVEKLRENFNIINGPVTFMDDNGEWQESVENILVAPMPMMVLEKIADLWLAVDFGRLSNFGLLTGGNRASLYEQPWKAKSPRIGGETEYRSFGSHANGGRTIIAEMIDRNGSIASQRAMATKLINTKDFGKIEVLIDRELTPYGGARGIQINQHRMICAGAKFVYKPEVTSIQCKDFIVKDDEPQEDNEVDENAEGEEA